ncbi:hypothetical protein K432DRAFT_435544 [Lepidopterella palustris CBS 459.81]|uniref:Methyltransferase domain-containing protein n=1 Tax=Lepidopterella palustris CBS 459.81 TaxID=1314670 RepID=A0A8E2E8I8_9PEZI|nr:hypothetical protein K432DRAFT_435544 [Lepidopterella palustris CBS 459.81]
MAPHSPPHFASSRYWDTRFQTNPTAFDWLQPASILDHHLTNALLDCPDQKPYILHIGCGTSLLSYHLRAHVKEPSQIHNVDFSKEAIDLGVRREREIFGETSEASQTERELYMRWSTADLLSIPSLLAVCEPASYDLIVEKSCSDAIACADDILISLPYPLLSTPPHPSNTLPTPSPYLSPSPSPSSSCPPPQSALPTPIHPLHILPLHLALLTKPGGRWIVLSYSSSRFPFLSPTSEDAIPVPVLTSGFPDPSQLWTLERTESVEAPGQRLSGEGGTVHSPKMLHWIYVFVRTEREVRVM